MNHRVIVYARTNPRVFFLLPSIAIGVGVDGKSFFEIAWLCWAIGLEEHYDG